VRITEFSLRNPLVVGGLAVALCIFGLFAYLRLGVAVAPNVNFPIVIVTTIYAGADPETVETNVTKPLEDAIATLPNIDTNGLTSTSAAGLSTISVQFNDAANADLVAVDVQRVVNGVRNKLPGDADLPTVMKLDFNNQGVATIVLSGKQPLARMQDLAENFLQQQLNAVPGVGSTTIKSGITRELHVVADEEKLRSRGLSINTLVGALQSQQLEVPAGTITQGTRDFNVYFDSLAVQVSQIGDLVVAQTAAGPVYLRDVATVEDTIKKRNTLVRVDDQEGIALVVVKLKDANTIAVVDAVKHKIAELTPQLPADTRLDVVVDASTYTAKSFHAVQNALIEAVLVTGLILLLFLHTWRSTLIVLVSIPISLLATLVMMATLHYNLNLLTMVALTVSVGILVDDSIVVLENIYRHLDMGKSPFQAALDGRAEIGLAAVTITLVDVVVYLPIAVMTTGIPNQFLAPFAVVITVATLSSLVVSFTITPLLARLFLTHGEQKSGNSPLERFGRAWDRGFLWLEHRYQALLRVSLPKRWLVILVGMLTFAAGISLPMLGLIGNDFFPSGDQSEIDVNLSMPPATSLEATDRVARAIEADLHALPEIRSVYSVVGQTGNFGPGSSPTGSDSAQIAGLLVRPGERHRSSAEIAEALRAQWGSKYPGAKIRIGLPNAFGFGGFGGAPIQARVQGSDPAIVNDLAAKVEAAIRGVPGAVEIENSNDNLQTQLRATIDWTRAADLGITPRDAGTALRTALDGFTSNQNQFRQTGRSAIPIRVLTANAAATSPEQISRLPVAGSKGVVELGQFTTTRTTRIPTSIAHVNRLRSVTIGSSAGGGRLVGDVQSDVEAAIKRIPFPSGYAVTYGGEGEAGGTAFQDIFRALGVAVLLMYMLMMMLFGSVTLPLAVLMSLPLALVGALGGLAITGSPFTLFSLLGVAVLVGLVGKNAILLVDYTDTLRRRGVPRREALLEAGPTRLRPIVMTTISVMAALLPIAAGLEEGSELLRSVAVVLIGGLLTSTLLTLVFVPAMYTIFDDVQELVVRTVRRIGRSERRAPARPVPTAQSVPVPVAVRARDD
jgi:HAE1 family hydrophobic/amphiphilic exporter-1